MALRIPFRGKRTMRKMNPVAKKTVTKKMRKRARFCKRWERRA